MGKKKDDLDEPAIRDERGRFVVGNQLWKSRSKHGRDLLFSMPDLLWDAATEYFTFCDDAPMPTPYSIMGFCLFVRASLSWFRNFRQNPALSSDFLTVIEEIEMVIKNQQWEGGMTGIFKENLTARSLNITDRTDLTSGGQPVQRVDLENYTVEELRQLANLQEKGKLPLSNG